ASGQLCGIKSGFHLQQQVVSPRLARSDARGTTSGCHRPAVAATMPPPGSQTSQRTIPLRPPPPVRLIPPPAAERGLAPAPPALPSSPRMAENGRLATLGASLPIAS